MWSSPTNATLDDRFFQNSPYFWFYGLVPISACFSNISLHNWPIKAWDSSNWSLGPNKGFLFCKLGVGVTWGYLGSLGVKIQTFSNLDNNISKWSSRCPDYKKVVSEVTRGHPTPNQGHLGSFGVKIQRFSNIDNLYTKRKLFVSWLEKNGFWGQTRSSDPELGAFRGHLGWKSKGLKNVFLYQVGAHKALITQKWFPGSPKVTYAHSGSF